MKGSTSTGGRWLARILRGVSFIESAVLVTLLSSMILLAVAQIVLRNAFDGGLFWGDGLLRVLVFWITLFGGMVAARRGTHIRIDVLQRLASRDKMAWVERLAVLFAAVMCGVMAFASARFVRWEYEDGLMAFGSVPAWACEIIIPVAMLVMGLRFALQAITGPPLSGDIPGVAGGGDSGSGMEPH